MDFNDGAPLVSVLMPMYNAGETIEAAMVSIINQTYQHWELIVLDDGSTDGSYLKVEKYQDKRIRLYPDKQRVGIAARLNQGLLLCKGKYIARMDADDISSPARIELQVAYMEKHLETDLLGTSITLADKSRRVLHNHYCPATHSQLIGNLSNGIALFHPTWLGKKEWFLKWRYQKTHLKYGGEDFDLLIRSIRSSRFACLEQPLLTYRYVFSLKKISINTFLMVFTLAKNKYWKAALLMLLKFPIRTMLSFLYLNTRKIKKLISKG